MESGEIFEGESLFSLEYKGLNILQRKDMLGVSTDSVLLSSFVRAKSTDTVVDIGAGGGIISILVNKRTGARVCGVELDDDVADMGRRSAKLNGQDDVSIVTLDLRSAPSFLGCEVFDVAVSNPPYHCFGDKSDKRVKAAATHEGGCTLDDVIVCASRLIKYGGLFFISYPTEYLAKLMHVLVCNHLEPKRMLLVTKKYGASPRLALIEAKKYGGAGLIVEPELVCHDSLGMYTPRMREYYHM